jgi:AraC-like DNA-binding protein
MFLMGLSQFLIKNKKRESYIYMASYTLMGLWVFQISLYSTHALNASVIMAYIIMPVNILAAIMMFLRYRIMVEGALIMERAFKLLFIFPVIAAAAAILPFLQGYDFSSEYFIFRPLADPSFYKLPPSFKMIHFMNFFSKLFLVVATSVLLLKNLKIWEGPATTNMKISRLGFVFGIFMILITALTGLGDILSYRICRWSVLMINADFFIIFLTSQHHPDFSRVITIFMNRGRYENSKIKGLNIQKILSEIKKIMEDEKAFAVEGISLTLVADELGITSQQLSQILNEKLNKSFNSFINEYRIDEAKKILIDEPERTIMSIALAVGFNSNTTFSTTFSSFSGMSPKDFRRKFLKQNVRS